MDRHGGRGIHRSMKTNRFRVLDTVTEGVLCEGSRKKVDAYLTGLASASPKVAPGCIIENYDDESGRWTKAA